ncbi:MAG: tetratricopeptide repeat protein, partial [Bdellovibrionales bacterium]|nr:tetratricopeptide repeat protein [Bdellovibrionales bacterium]
MKNLHLGLVAICLSVSGFGAFAKDPSFLQPKIDGFDVLNESIESLNEILSTDAAEPVLLAQNSRSKRQRSATRRASGSDLINALKLTRSRQYKDASILLFRLSHSPKYASKRIQIKYILGHVLFQLKMNQVAAFQFIRVVKQGKNKYLRQAIEKLSLAADYLGDDTLLNYAISRVSINQFPRVHRDMLYYRIGEYQLRNKQFDQAAESFSRVRPNSLMYSTAKYHEGLAYASGNKPKSAMKAFDELADVRADKGVTDAARVAALIGRARVAYQAKDWDRAITYYREVPRDTEMWHDTLFESSWAMLQSGRFRSALSNFQSLHSAYYEDFYLPESLLLRSIVYLYICKYEEMDKVLALFNKIYKPVFVKIDKILDQKTKPEQFFNEVVKVIRDYKLKGDDIDKTSYVIPFLVVRRILQEGDFQNSYNYIKKLLDERKTVRSMPVDWKTA